MVSSIVYMLSWDVGGADESRFPNSVRSKENSQIKVKVSYYLRPTCQVDIVINTNSYRTIGILVADTK